MSIAATRQRGGDHCKSIIVSVSTLKSLKSHKDRSRHTFKLNSNLENYLIFNFFNFQMTEEFVQQDHAENEATNTDSDSDVIFLSIFIFIFTLLI